jgi:HEPN domain-containing protein
VELPKSITYHLALASGFLQEAEQDFTLERLRSWVDNAQLAVENAGKVALALFGTVPKTHDPARRLLDIAQLLPDAIRSWQEERGG